MPPPTGAVDATSIGAREPPGQAGERRRTGALEPAQLGRDRAGAQYSMPFIARIPCS